MKRQTKKETTVIRIVVGSCRWCRRLESGNYCESIYGTKGKKIKLNVYVNEEIEIGINGMNKAIRH